MSDDFKKLPPGPLRLAYQVVAEKSAQLRAFYSNILSDIFLFVERILNIYLSLRLLTNAFNDISI